MLKYFFSVLFDDGTTYEQNQDDKSLIDSSRSCYFDLVRLQEEGKKITQFVLTGDEHIYCVDLKTGEFVVNGARFKLYEGEINTELRLIYFRRHTHEFNLNCEELGHRMVYRFGWQTEIDGKNIQRVMEVA